MVPLRREKRRARLSRRAWKSITLSLPRVRRLVDRHAFKKICRWMELAQHAQQTAAQYLRRARSFRRSRFGAIDRAIAGRARRRSPHSAPVEMGARAFLPLPLRDHARFAVHTRTSCVAVAAA